MENIAIEKSLLFRGAEFLSREGADARLRLPAVGGGLSLPQLIDCPERYVVFFLECREAHSLSINLKVYPQGSLDVHCFDMRFGVMPGVRALICLDLQWMDARALFPETTPGQMKVVCHGGRVNRREAARITLENSPCHHDLEVVLSDILLTDERPEAFPLPDLKLIDKMGQYKRKAWPGKSESVGAMCERLRAAVELPDAFSIESWDEYGGFTAMPLQPGTGFFTRTRVDGRWYLTDPLGNAFFSVGPDCVVARSDCRVDGLEHFFDWLPPEDDPVYGPMYGHHAWPPPDAERRRDCTLFSFEQANLYRAFGVDWFAKWQALMCRQLKQNGLNTLGNWSDERILGPLPLPYVTMLPKFPSTSLRIFRDFPDVFSDEYLESAERCAEYLRPRANDPLMIGYFLRNEPAWAFVNNLVIADEVLFNPAPSACRRELINWLEQKYASPEALSGAWGKQFDSFEALNEPIEKASALSKAAEGDLREFSRRMLEAYVGIPSRACRAADPNHMNLGMRWAWISDPDIVTGWQHFDVFSINCYRVDPTDAIDNVAALGVDLPVVIGEFHFGALDGGQSATGLEGVENQQERGAAYRYYVERVAAHPASVGCHWFQCYDQFELGRFDGENYNIGLFDVCSLPSPEMMAAVRRTSRGIYDVKTGRVPPTERKPRSIPMIAY
jgi:hypothetical protein